MASSPTSSSLMLLALIIVGCSLLPPACSIPRRALDHHHQMRQKGFRVDLINIDSEENLSNLELVTRAIKRGKHRKDIWRTMATGSMDTDIRTKMRAGSGEFLMNISIGTPPTPFMAIMDTGSDLIWTQCKPCTNCFNQSTPIFDPKYSSSFSKLPCSSKLCRTLQKSMCNSNGCEYLSIYADDSASKGIMANETFTFGDPPNGVSIPHIGFGCGMDNDGRGFTEGAGLVGLGRGPSSLVSQLGSRKFGYCLTSISDPKPSSLLFGHLSNLNKTNNSTKSTPLIRNPFQPSFYYLSLEGITVGNTLLPISKSAFALRGDGSGGLIVDTGTTITYLEDTSFETVKSFFASQMELQVVESDTGLDLCFSMPSDRTKIIKVPKLIFHFKGLDLELPKENYMITDSKTGLLCLAMAPSGPLSILGNIQQQNMLVLHDLKKETMSFIPTQCDKL